MEDKAEQHGQDIISNLDKLRKRLPDSSALIDGIQSKMKEVVKFGLTLDYKDYPVNGVRTVIKLVYQWTCHIADEEARSDEEVQNFVPILQLINHWFRLLDNIRDPIKRDKEARMTHLNILANFNSDAYRSIHLGGYYRRANREMGPLSLFGYIFKIMQKYALPGMCDSFLLQFTSSYPTLMDGFVNNLGRIRDMDVMKKNVMSFGNRISRLINYFLYRRDSKEKPPVDSKWVEMEVDSRYDVTVSVDEVKLVQLKENKKKKKKIRFSVLRDPSSKDHEEKLLIYIHGGGFMGPPTIMFNNSFIKDGWCNQLPGLNIINLDYSYSPEKPFPHGLLDILDAYLWFSSGLDSVKDVLGFQPKEILVTGDSAGGHFSILIPILLNEIRLLDPHHHPIRMPSAILPLFPKITMDDTPMPSYILSSIDILLVVHACDALLRAYVPLKYRVEGENSNKWVVSESNRDVPVDCFSREGWDFIRSPLLSPLYYDKMNDLSTVRMYIMALEMDPLLDDAVEIAKVWKGPVDFTFVPGVIHGANAFHRFSRGGKRVQDASVDMIKKALQQE